MKSRQDSIRDLKLKGKLLEIKNSYYNLLDETIWNNRNELSWSQVQRKLNDIYHQMAKESWLMINEFGLGEGEEKDK